MSDQQVQQEPPITYEHVIGQQQLEIIMLRKEVQNAQQTMQQQQELINELRSSIEPDEKEAPTPIKAKRSS